MVPIERVLASGSSSPKDFTLHDAGHSFRVTEWMAKIIPPSVLTAISDYEIALLILTAYLHDIGMTPKWGKVSVHREYLISGKEGKFLGDELDQFQLWLAMRKGLDFSPPVTTLEDMEELLTHYCRARHNDWTAEWISKEMSGNQVVPYLGWIEDLILICKSHHQGHGSLSSNHFDPRDLGAQGLVHRRYLACVLRIADVLENDPERTPDVILRHRAITASSEVYWRKDKYITEHLSDGRVLISATPPTAVLYRAVEETIDSIEAELQLCSRLSREHPFDIHPLTGQKSLPHRWELEPLVIRKVQEKPGAFEYIPGAFRPNTKKILDLLAGQHLYGDELAAVRELLQNAFDSVKEQIAREQLKRKRPDEQFRMLLQRQNEITIELRKSGDLVQLFCRDTGVGMSKQVIKDRLLVSGESSSAQLVALQLECKKNGIRLERSGQFGIGVLSYFMIADHLVFRTRPSQETNSEDSHGWEFETWGIGSFGELRPVEGLPSGTEVRMDLRKSLFESTRPDAVYGFFEKLRQFLLNAIVATPCPVNFIAAIEGCVSVQLSPGWAEAIPHASSALYRQVVDAFRDNTKLEGSPDQSLSSRELEHTQDISEHRRFFGQRFSEALKWHGPFNGELPEDLGRFSISLPYFDLSGDASLAYLFMVSDSPKGECEIWNSWNYHGVLPPAAVQFAVAGFKVALQNKLDFGSCWQVKLDLLDSAHAKIQVDRHAATLTKEKLDLISKFLAAEIVKASTEFLVEHSQSTYSSLNNRIFWRSHQANAHKLWAVTDSATLTWRTVNFPCAVARCEKSSPRFCYRERKRNADPNREAARTRWMLSGLPLTVCCEIRLWIGIGRSQTFAPFDSSPDRLVQAVGNTVTPIMIWDNQSQTSSLQPIQPIAFPPEWQNVLGFVTDLDGSRRLLLNSGHAAVRNVDVNELQKAAQIVAMETFEVSRSHVFPTEQRRPEIRSSRAASLEWLLATLTSGRAEEVWRVLTEQDPDFLTAVWSALNVTQDEAFLILDEQAPLLGDASAIYMASPKQFKVSYFFEPALVATPAPNWKICDDSIGDS